MPDVRGKRVFLLGDSLSAGQFSPGKVMADQLALAGATVKINARSGRSAWNFFSREDYLAQFELARAFDPHLAVIVLGTNDIGMSLTSTEQRMREIREALAEGGVEVWAFGPPTFPTSGPGSDLRSKVGPVIAVMKSVFQTRFIDLRPLSSDMVTSGRAADGIHFTAAGGQKLGGRMADYLLGASGETGEGWLLLGTAVLAYFLFR